MLPRSVSSSAWAFVVAHEFYHAGEIASAGGDFSVYKKPGYDFLNLGVASTRDITGLNAIENRATRATNLIMGKRVPMDYRIYNRNNLVAPFLVPEPFKKNP